MMYGLAARRSACATIAGTLLLVNIPQLHAQNTKSSRTMKRMTWSFKLDPDAQATTRTKLTAVDGGAFELAGANGNMRIVFPKGSLPGDTDLQAAPLRSSPTSARSVLLNGFTLNAAGRSQLDLARPATIAFSTKKPIGKRTSIIRFSKDGKSYDVMRTKRVTANGETTLTARADHFSTYSVAEPCLAPDNRTRDEAGSIFDHEWPGIIEIDDTETFSNGPMTSSVAIRMSARSEDLRGPYNATATSKTTNQMSAGGGNINAPATTRIPPFSFTLKGGAFTETGASMYSATGTIQIKSAGTGTVTAPGGGASGATQSSATVPYTITIRRNQAVLEIQVGPQTLRFNGTFRQDRSIETFEKVFARKARDIHQAERAAEQGAGEAGWECSAPEETFPDDEDDWWNDLRYWSSKRLR